MHHQGEIEDRGAAHPGKLSRSIREACCIQALVELFFLSFIVPFSLSLASSSFSVRITRSLSLNFSNLAHSTSDCA